VLGLHCWSRNNEFLLISGSGKKGIQTPTHGLNGKNNIIDSDSDALIWREKIYDLASTRLSKYTVLPLHRIKLLGNTCPVYTIYCRVYVILSLFISVVIRQIPNSNQIKLSDKMYQN